MEIQGFEKYLIYPDGRVWSNKGKGRFLKPTKQRGYLAVKLLNNELTKTIRIHRLVAIHYIPNPKNNPQVDHINRIRDDNRIENLRWVNLLEQAQNKGIQMNNKTGHENICFVKRKVYQVGMRHTGSHRGKREFKNKIDAICYKFILLLKIKSIHYK